MSVSRPVSSRPAGVELLAFLEGRRLADLEAYYLFWIGSDPVPDARAELVKRLHRRMRNTEAVRARMKYFSRSQREVLLAVLDADDHCVPKTAVLQGTLTDAVKPYEIEVATRTLLKRGVLAEVTGGPGRPGAYCIPRELGEVLRRIHRAVDRAPRTLFSLSGFLEGIKTDAISTLYGAHLAPEEGGDRESLVRALTDPARIRARLETIADARLRSFVETVIGQFGGILTRSLFGRIDAGGLTWDVEAFREVLEGHLLGTACHLNFEGFGIGLMEEGVVIFREVVDAELDARRPVPGRAARRVDLGADVLSDIRRILSFLGRETVKVTQDQAIYKAVRKRILDDMILREAGRLTRDKVLDFLLEFMREKEFFRAGASNVIRPTRDGHRFVQASLPRQLQQVLKHVLSTFPVETGSFHQRTLMAIFLERFRGLEPEPWIDPMELPFRARNAYLSELEERSVKEAFQAKYEYAMNPPREDPFQMAWRLNDLLCEWFLLLGLVEAAVERERIVAIRVTPLGRRLLGPQAEKDSASGTREAPEAPASSPSIIVNPDFEVLVHPGPDTLEITYFLDRFAERLHADHHLHFRIDRERFQDMVGQGADAERVIESLAASARPALPENVVVTLRDWAVAVQFMDATEVLLLECEEPEVLDRVEALREVKRAVYKRLGPTALALHARRVTADLAETLRGMGVFLR